MRLPGTVTPDEIEHLTEVAADALTATRAAAALGDESVGALRPVVEAVLAETAAQRWIDRQIEQIGVRSMDFRNGVSMEVEPAREMVAHWVGAARAMLGNAPNYTETPIEMVVGVGESPERYAFVLQRVGNLTPHQARQKAEKERDEALAEVGELRARVAELVERGDGEEP